MPDYSPLSKMNPWTTKDESYFFCIGMGNEDEK
jgi:hypothetical protein